jgi:hypothetical protein
MLILCLLRSSLLSQYLFCCLYCWSRLRKYFQLYAEFVRVQRKDAPGDIESRDDVRRFLFCS